MALVKCKECGHEISKSAAACPNCGHKVKRTGCGTAIVAIFFGSIAIAVVVSSISGNRDRSRQAQQVKTEQAKLAAMTPEERAAAEEVRQKNAQIAAEAKRRAAGLMWVYAPITDEMASKKGKQARINSVNEIEFKFPYQGAQRATLIIRNHPRHGNDVLLLIQRGQFRCGIRECTVQVKFDDGQAVGYTAVPPSDNDSEVLFIRNFDAFVRNTKKAKTVRIEAEFFQSGRRVFEFDVQGLEWP